MTFLPNFLKFTTNTEIESEQKQKCTAANKRFAASGGVARPTVCGNLEVLSPVRAAVKPPPAASRLDVVRNRRTPQRDTECETQKDNKY
jgi:hypothetical protein